MQYVARSTLSIGDSFPDVALVNHASFIPGLTFEERTKRRAR